MGDQLDLFLDSRAVMLANDAVGALAARDAARAGARAAAKGGARPSGATEAELPAWFPAWFLVEHPVARKELGDIAFPDSPPASAARLLVALFALERRGDQRRLAGERERLRRLNRELFALYMARRAVQYL